MKTLFIDAQGAGSVGRALTEFIPSSIRSISGVLEDKNLDYDVALVEEFLRNPRGYQEHDMFLITGMSSDSELIERAGDIINNWKGVFVIGGPITFDPIFTLNEVAPYIAIIGEGEQTFLKLLDQGLADGGPLDEAVLSNLDGIAYRSKKDKEIKVNYPRKFLSKEELNNFFPSTNVIKYYPFYQNLTVVLEILRGCSNFHRPESYHEKTCIEECEICESKELSERLSCPQGIPAGCGFCSVPNLYGPPRSREQEAIVKEVRELIACGASKITIVDPDPLDYKREELVEPEPLTDPAFPMPNYGEIERLGEMLWDIPEVAEESVVITVRDVKATLVTEKSAELLKRYFPRSVFGIGCESGAKDHCIKLGRPYEPGKVLEAAKILNRQGIKPKVNFIVGLPWQTQEVVQETIQLMDRLEDYTLYFDLYRFESLPKSAFEDKPSDIGPLQAENKLWVSKVNSIQKRLFERFVGERQKVVIGVYGRSKEKLKEGSKKGSKPKRGFRKLLGVVGYPIFDKGQLGQFATVVKILNPSPDLKTGDIKVVEIKAASEAGFRVVFEGNIINEPPLTLK